MNCILYARVSTDKQAQKDLSIPAQIDIMKDYAKRNGWKIIGNFIDKGESARTANRPELKKLIQYCKEEKNVDIVIVHKIDRLARNLVDYATIKAILKQKGIRLVSISEPFDDNPVGHLLENIIASISEWYSANLGEEVKKANLSKLKKGEWPHKPPIGYKSIREENNRVKHVPNTETAPLIRQAFELFSTGDYSLKTLAEEMAERGLKTKFGKIHSREAVKRILTRSFYISKLEWQGKEYKGNYEPIISEELFYRVQQILKSRSVDSGEKGKLDFLLRGVAYCKSCGRKLTAEKHPRGSYYRCLSNFYKKEKCNEPYIPVEFLDFRLEDLYARLQPPKKLLELLKFEVHEITKRRKNISENEVKILERTIGDLENKQLKLLDEMVSGKVDRNIYEKMEKKYLNERREAEARLSQFEVDYDDPLDFLDKAILVSSTLLYLHQKFNPKQRKELLRAVFEKIYVKDGQIVDANLNPPFSSLLREDIKKLFENNPVGATCMDILEQITEELANFFPIGKHSITKGLIELVVKNAKSIMGES